MQANQATVPATKLRVLRIDASARVECSITRQLADLMLRELDERVSGLTVARRDVSQGLPFVETAWLAPT